MLTDLYETKFGIYNHLSGHNKKRPIASVAFHDSEENTSGSLLEEAMRTYITKGIKDLYGIDFVAFMELPIDIIELLVLVAGEEGSKKAAAISAVENEFKAK